MYVKTTRHPDLPPPLSEVGPLGWLRKNLFSSWLNSLMTLAAVGLLLAALPPVLNWGVFSANWVGQTKDACLPPLGNRAVKRRHIVDQVVGRQQQHHRFGILFQQ